MNLDTYTSGFLFPSREDGGAAEDGAGSSPGEAEAPTSACDGKADGEPCGAEGSNRICLSGACLSSHCGDGWVDAGMGEECEDLNYVSGDGCSACRYDCREDADCDDGHECNGVESCDADSHTCVPGPAAGEGAPCAMAGGVAGVCHAGVCAPRGCGDGVEQDDEECDDGNAVPGDGCEADCTFTCTSDADCDDGDACNGAEVCDDTDPTRPVCAAGAPVECPVVEDCRVACTPETGECVYADVDADGVPCDEDCNDSDPDVRPGAAECLDGKDNDCDASTPDGADGDCRCWVDEDGDGYATASAGTLAAVECPEGHTDRDPGDAGGDAADCDDAEADVHPGQTEWFTTGYCTTSFCPFGNFDYNCDDQEEQRYRNVSAFCGGGGNCAGYSGWKTSVPGCGEEGVFIDCRPSGPLCSSDEITMTQACR